MNQIRLDKPGLDFERRPLTVEAIMEKRGVLVIPFPEDIIALDVSIPESLDPVAAAAHWRQAAFHNQEFGSKSMHELQRPMHKAQLAIHLAALGVAERAA